MPSPPFSIITVSYNAIKTLEQTIKSVLLQDRTLFEYIIIDGRSNDGTVDYIKKYEKDIKYWISEQDKGIYDAMNKGIEKAEGRWILFLGADDRLEPNILNEVNKYLDDSMDLIFGNVIFTNGKKYNSTFNVKTLLNNTVHHQGAFYNRKIFETFRYDISIKIMADYELNLLIYLARMRRKKLDIVVSECNLHGLSSEVDNTLQELDLIHDKYYNFILKLVVSNAIKIKYFLHYKLLNIFS
ncbi:glycosyltransferase [Spirosoma aureum]|uniref:Glycosyltransferase n=1 Tax=Spirosoma aureum TaxID=2692134 RepID=A0A6G9AHU9_9BACT|nr:glycosyltransferase family 2 protein [Spirosoma aureum]QIP12030.1 glycosyltransferase [Spirosoma aureum]